MRQFVRIGSTALGIALAGLTAWSTFGAVGCVITTEDDTDGGVTDTGTTGDTANPGTTGSIRVKAADLLTSSTTDDTLIKDFGGGSTYSEITGLKIAYAKAKITSGPTGVGTEFPAGTDVIGKSAAGGYVDGVVSNLAPGAYEITVNGYLRGVVGENDATPDTRVFFAQTTCSVTVAVDLENPATCTPLSITDASGDLLVKGIIFPSDFLGPSGGAAYALTTSGMDLDVWRARTPTSGTALASITQSDAQGVIFINEAKFISSESASARETAWSISVEQKSASVPACTTAPGCKVTRGTAAAPLDLVVVNPATHAGCVATPTTTSSTACFQ